MGIVPMEALVNCAEYYLQIEDFSIDQVLERQIWPEWEAASEAVLWITGINPTSFRGQGIFAVPSGFSSTKGSP